MINQQQYQKLNEQDPFPPISWHFQTINKLVDVFEYYILYGKVVQLYVC